VWATATGATGAKLLLVIAIGAQLFCGMSSITANSRMIYAFSRIVADACAVATLRTGAAAGFASGKVATTG
jgi:amino acid transporter